MKKEWNERFGSTDYIYGVQPNAFIKDHSSRLTGTRIVAFAEGEGRNAVYLAAQGYDVTAWDYADNGLKKTEQLAERSGVKVRTELVDLIHDPVVPGAYDGAIMVFGHFPKESQHTVLEKLIAVVKPGGTVMVEVYSEEQLRYKTGGPKSSDMLYRAQDMLAWARQHQVVHFFYGEQIREEGKLHTGAGHVIQVILIKT
ncbi:class I SAM-dependent methyltransferase [Paenibacillus sp. CCS19]|uniref:class I SAM-dependent methyltransferase n=1 Tax=Paenibacillus sp. CCS19 TaxID=3158387 RepID=UPI00295E35E9|nr:class I SAM-dependent methyltransferase [Paenibacillus cellulosilyticus]